MKILIAGAGMYVTGRGGTGTGTILSSLAQYSRNNPVESVTVVARSAGSAADVAEAANRINTMLGTRLEVRYERLASDGDLARHLSGNRYHCGIVSVPDHAHFEVTRDLLAASVPALVVKPLTPTLGEARELLRLSRESQCYGAVEFHKRFDETNLYARKLLDRQGLGKLLYITVDYSQRISIPTVVFRQWAAKTNIFQYLGVHYVDLIHFLTGYHPVRAMAIGTRGVLHDQGITEFDSVHATIVWRASQGAELVSQFACNWIDPDCSSALSDQKYKIVGTQGRLELDQKNRGLELVTPSAGIQQVNPWFSEYLPDGAGTSFSGYGYKSIERFLRDVTDLGAGRVQFRDLEENRPSFKASMPSVAVIEAVNASLANGSSWEAISETI